MKLNPTVAVIMSVYKNDDLKHLNLALQSLLEQTYCSIEIFICCDGPLPSDITKYLNEACKTKNVNIIFNETNIGLAKSLNLLIEHILVDHPYVDFFARMDSDDISHRDRIEKQVAYFKNNLEIEVCGTACREFGSDVANPFSKVNTEHGDIRRLSVVKCPMIHPSVMFRASVFDKGFRYPEDTSYSEDVALWFELLTKGIRFGNINEALLDYRLSDHTIRRRQGIKKGVSEFSLRVKYMLLLSEVTFKNIILVSFRLVFHILPFPIVKWLYKNMREPLK